MIPLAFKEEQDYVYIFADVHVASFEMSCDYWSRIVAYCKEKGFKKALVEADVAEALTPGDSFELIHYMIEIGLAGIKVAYVDPKIAHKEINEFGATAGTNRGINGRIFDNVAEAEKWLTSDAK